jgi:Glyoxalase-like domain
MPIAAYKDLCIDASDAGRLQTFYAAALRLDATQGEGGGTWLAGPTPQHTVWINEVPEPKSVKNRVHIDVHCVSVAELEELGARVLVPSSQTQRWTVMADPEGQEFCAFVRESPPDYRLYEVAVDCADPIRVGEWWGEVFGVPVDYADDQSWCWLENLPGVPFSAFSFAPVPESKLAKNRVHWDVSVDTLEPLLAVGATVLRAQDDEIGWTVMADVEGNEFCAFLGT